MEYSEFSRFGLTFKRLSIDTLEMLRQWRNSDDVRPYMIYQKIISPEDHLKWYESLDKKTNFYYFAYYNNEPFGVYSIKDIDFEKKTGEPGVFLKNKSLWEGEFTLRGSFSLLLFVFEELNLETEIIHVLKTNKKALSYNKQLGFKINAGFRNKDFFELILKEEEFFENKEVSKILNYLEKS